jgi:hypothetical protein
MDLDACGPPGPLAPGYGWALVTDEQALDIGGRDITVTSPGKVFFAERGETKLELVRYYLAVAEPFLRSISSHVRGADT